MRIFGMNWPARTGRTGLRAMGAAARRGVIALSIVLAGVLLPVKAGIAETLTVALYPYVPRVDQFKTAITEAWQKVQPSVNLVYVPTNEWDGGYSDDPKSTYDVFVFDAMYFEYFRSKGYLASMSPGEIANESDFLSYAIDGVKVSGNYYAIPLLGCANILFFDKANTALKNATTLSDVNSALGQCTYTSEIPPDRRGLMVDMAGTTTNVALYADTAHSLTGTYPLPQPAPSNLNQQAIANMTSIMSMASFRDATAHNVPAYGRAAWYNSGYGTAYVGYTESMSQMSASTLANIDFKVMPLSNAGNRPLFYADVIGVNAAITNPGRRALAVQLANVMAASDTVVNAYKAETTGGNPQYLMATRTSVFKTLAQTYPLYANMLSLVTDNNPLMFKLDASARTWITSVGSTIKTETRTAYTCGCDFPAAQPIFGNASAPPICNATCLDHGGWNGQWTNQYPAAQDGSVCGCNSCPTGLSLTLEDVTKRPHY